MKILSKIHQLALVALTEALQSGDNGVEMEKHIDCVQQVLDACHADPFFRKPESEVMPNFEVVTPEWIKAQMEQLKMSQKDLANALNTTESYVSLWLSGHKNFSRSSKVAIYYYFQIQNDI